MAGRPWTDRRVTPYCTWVDHIWTKRITLQNTSEMRSIDWWESCPGWVAQITSQTYCYMGSALAPLTHQRMSESSAENVSSIVGSIKSPFDDQHVAEKDQYQVLKITQYMPARGRRLPKLKGTGQQCKKLTKVVHTVFDMHMEPNDDIHQLVLLGLRCIRDSDVLIGRNHNSDRFPPEDSHRLIRSSFLVAQTTTALIQHSHPHTPLFHYTIEQHYTFHIAMSSRFTNPVHGDCSTAEDLMQIVRKLVHGTVHGNRIHKVGNVALTKYPKYLHLACDAASPWWVE